MREGVAAHTNSREFAIQMCVCVCVRRGMLYRRASYTRFTCLYMDIPLALVPCARADSTSPTAVPARGPFSMRSARKEGRPFLLRAMRVRQKNKRATPKTAPNAGITWAASLTLKLGGPSSVLSSSIHEQSYLLLRCAVLCPSDWPHQPFASLQ